MKYLKQLCIFAVTAILLSSCGSISISQKRYSKGLNIAWFSGKDEVKTPKVSPKKRPIQAIEPVQKSEILIADAPESNAIETQETTEAAVVAEAPVHTIDLGKNSQVSKASQKILAPDKPTQKQLRKILPLQKALNLSKVKETHESNGALKTIGWVFIILGIVFVLIISILIGVLFMLLGLLFVIAGK